MTDSGPVGAVGSAARVGKRERLVAAARELMYRQGVARTTLADIASAADVPLGNVYYYFKTKDDIIAAVLRSRAEELTTAIAELEREHHDPKARLKALVASVAAQRETTARYGCPYGTLSAELAKLPTPTDEASASLMRITLDWAQRQFAALGRPDARDLAIELITAYQGSTVLSSALGQPELMADQARRLTAWIDALPG